MLRTLKGGTAIEINPPAPEPMGTDGIEKEVEQPADAFPLGAAPVRPRLARCSGAAARTPRGVCCPWWIVLRTHRGAVQTGLEGGAPLTAEQVLAARERLRGRIVETPVVRSVPLSELCGAEVWLKVETLQVTGSFKARGATNRLLGLQAQGIRHVVAASAGNHARAVAYAARALGLGCTVVMPTWASPQKVRNTERLGAEVVLLGDTIEAAMEEARARARDGVAFVHPYDDWDVIAGQGTIGLEILDQVPGVRTIVVPVGGGGLCAGIIAAVDARDADVHVIPVRSAPDATLPDGIRVKAPGERPSRLLTAATPYRYVGDAAVAEAMTFLLEEHAILAEGAGAAGIAALLSGDGSTDVQGPAVVVISGGNVDLAQVQKAIDFGLRAAGRLARLRLRIPDVPGTLAAQLGIIGRLGGNVRGIEHDRGEVGVPPGLTLAHVTIETRGSAHLAEIRAAVHAEVDGVDVPPFPPHR